MLNSSNNKDIINKIWKDDKLERKGDIEYLSNYLFNLYAENKFKTFVLNVNSSWGGGKTFLMERWSKSLKKIGYPVVFFNAWASDFYDDPLFVFLSEMGEALTEMNGIDNFINKGKKLLFKTSKFGGNTLNLILDILSRKIGGLSSKEFEKHYKETRLEPDEFMNIKKELKDFKEEIKKIVNAIAETGENCKSKHYKLPLFIFIDELDRCRPTYAIQVLEKIKHVFGVEGVFFIIATDSRQLCNIIKSIYGSDFDALGYLKKFFNQEYTIPKPNYLQYSEFIINQFNISKNDFSLYTPILTNDQTNKKIKAVSNFQYTFSLLSKYFKLSLRDMEQAILIFDSCIKNKVDKEVIHIVYLLFLIMLKIKNSYIYFDYLKGIPKIGNISDFLKRLDLDSSVIFNKGFDKFSVDTLIKIYINISFSNDIFSILNPNGNNLEKSIREAFIAMTESNNPYKGFTVDLAKKYSSMVDIAGKAEGRLQQVDFNLKIKTK